ncbi:hypothetical protein ACD661_15165 [Legionella lytica]|uniref:Substrate of the Dot/Icm secretion system n=1 Tax=Legionella lytica TaxID=96232 RepID=A0ABW8DB15_9GAMM
MSTSQHRLEELLQQAHLTTFLAKNAYPEERLTGPRLYQAFLPASKTISNERNSSASFDEKAWGEDGLNTAREAAEKLKGKQFPNLLKLYTFIARKRANYEYKKNGKAASFAFGSFRDPDDGCHMELSTCLGKDDEYQDQYGYMLELLQIFFPNPDIKMKNVFDKNSRRVEAEMSSFIIRGTLRREIDKNPYSFKEPGEYERTFTTIETYKNPRDGVEFIYLLHPNIERYELDEFFNLVETKFPDLYDLTNREKSINSLAEIVWTLAQAVPTKRGNASIIERLYRSVQLIHGEHLPHYRFPLNIDLLAIVTPSAEQFRQIFETLFYDKDMLSLIDKNLDNIQFFLQFSQEPHNELTALQLQLNGLKEKFRSKEQCAKQDEIVLLVKDRFRYFNSPSPGNSPNRAAEPALSQKHF